MAEGFDDEAAKTVNKASSEVVSEFTVVVVKTEIDNFYDNEFESTSISVQDRRFSNPFENISLQSSDTECSRSKTLDCNKIILGSKPNTANNNENNFENSAIFTKLEEDSIEEYDFEESVMTTHEPNLVLHDIQSYLHKSRRFCNLCGTLFAERNNYEHHVQIYHTGNVSERYKCYICAKKFFGAHVLRTHLMCIHNVKPSIHTYKSTFANKIRQHRCVICAKKFVTLQVLQRHLVNIHNVNYANKSQISSRQSNLDYTAKAFEKIGHVTSFGLSNTCYHCKKLFDTQKSLIEHLYDVLQMKRKNTEIVPVLKSILFKCNKCDIHFTSSQFGANHIEHMELLINWKCTVCNRIFKKEDALSHERQHSVSNNFLVCNLGEVDVDKILYKCSKCGTHFTESNFLYHFRDCGLEVTKSWNCRICNITLDGNLETTHKSDIHTEPNVYTVIESDVVSDNPVKSTQKKTQQKVQSIKLRKSIRDVKIVVQRIDSDRRNQLNRSNTLKCSRIPDSGCDFKSPSPAAANHTSARVLEDKKNRRRKIPSKSVNLTYYFCQTCKCFVTKFKKVAHLEERCKKCVKVKCPDCDLKFTNGSIATHRRLHEKHNMTLNNFKFFDLYSGKPINPKIHEVVNEDKPVELDIPCRKGYMKYYFCETCKCFVNKFKKDVHKERRCINLTSVACKHCGLMFTKGAIATHVRLHEGKKMSIENFKFYNIYNGRPLNRCIPGVEIKEQPLHADQLQKHRNVTYYYCETCTCFVTQFKKLTHINGRCKNLAKVTCRHCGLMFTKGSIETHIRVHEEKKMTVKNFTFLNLYSGTPLNRSVGEATNKENALNVDFQQKTLNMVYYYCETCKCFVTDFRKATHLKRRCKNLAKVSCQHCGLMFTKGSIETHRRVHEERKMTLKNFSFINLYNGKPLNRSVAQMANSEQSSTLNVQQNRHSLTYYFCGTCKCFVTKFRKNTHLERRCESLDKVACKHCGLTFTSGSISTHIRVHEEKRMTFKNFQFFDLYNGQSINPSLPESANEQHPVKTHSVNEHHVVNKHHSEQHCVKENDHYSAKEHHPATSPYSINEYHSVNEYHRVTEHHCVNEQHTVNEHHPANENHSVTERDVTKERDYANERVSVHEYEPEGENKNDRTNEHDPESEHDSANNHDYANEHDSVNDRDLANECSSTREHDPEGKNKHEHANEHEFESEHDSENSHDYANEHDSVNDRDLANECSSTREHDTEGKNKHEHANEHEFVSERDSANNHGYANKHDSEPLDQNEHGFSNKYRSADEPDLEGECEHVSTSDHVCATVYDSANERDPNHANKHDPVSEHNSANDHSINHANKYGYVNENDPVTENNPLNEHRPANELDRVKKHDSTNDHDHVNKNDLANGRGLVNGHYPAKEHDSAGKHGPESKHGPLNEHDTVNAHDPPNVNAHESEHEPANELNSANEHDPENYHDPAIGHNPKTIHCSTNKHNHGNEHDIGNEDNPANKHDSAHKHVPEGKQKSPHKHNLTNEYDYANEHGPAYKQNPLNKRKRDKRKVPNLSYYYCKVCKCFVTRFKMDIHLKGDCKQFVSDVCPHCGLMFTVASLVTHKRQHEKNNMTLKHFKFFDLHNGQPINPEIVTKEQTSNSEPEEKSCNLIYYYCETCKCYVSKFKKDAHVLESCKELPTFACNYCGLLFAGESIVSHRCLHQQIKGLTVNNFKLFNLSNGQPMNPPIPEVVNNDGPAGLKKNMCNSLNNAALFDINNSKAVNPYTAENVNTGESISYPERRTRKFTYYYCKTCKCFVNKDVAHIMKRCEKLTKVACQHCGLMFTSGTIATHRLLHEQNKLKLKHFEFLDLENEQPINPCHPEVTQEDGHVDTDLAHKRNIIKYYYCETCKCCITEFNKTVHKEECYKELTKIACKYCGLLLTNTSYEIHRRRHEESKYLTLANFTFFDLLSGLQINPPIPEYPKCVLCAVHFFTDTARKCHICTEVKSLTCHICEIKLSEAAFKLHMTFHQHATDEIEALKLKNPPSAEVKDTIERITEVNTPKLATGLSNSLDVASAALQDLSAIGEIVYTCANCSVSIDAYDKVVEHSQRHYELGDTLTQTVFCSHCNINIDESCYPKHRKGHEEGCQFKLLKFDSYYLPADNNMWVKHIFQTLTNEQVSGILRKSIYRFECRIKMEIIQNGYPGDFTVYKCDQCACFIEPRSMFRHSDNSCFKMRLHTCTICGIPFNSAASRIDHEKIHDRSDVTKDSYRIVVFNRESDKELNRSFSLRKNYVLYKCRNCGVVIDPFQKDTHHCDFINVEKCPDCELLLNGKDFESHMIKHKEFVSFNYRNMKVILLGKANCNMNSENILRSNFKGAIYDYKMVVCSKCGICIKDEKSMPKHICLFGKQRLKCLKCELYFSAGRLKTHTRSHEQDPDFLRLNMYIHSFDPCASDQNKNATITDKHCALDSSSDSDTEMFVTGDSDHTSNDDCG